MFRPPHLVLFDESGGRVEVRDVTTGRMCEVIEEKGMKPLRQSRNDQALMALRPPGLLELVEVGFVRWPKLMKRLLHWKGGFDDARLGLGQGTC